MHACAAGFRHALRMNSTRRVGLGLAAVATALWIVIVVAVFTTRPEDGVNIGAALLAMVAVPMSLAASVTLLIARSTAAREGTPDRSATGRAAAVLALLSLLLLPVPIVLGPMDHVVPPQLLFGSFFGGITTFVVSSVLFLTTTRRR